VPLRLPPAAGPRTVAVMPSPGAAHTDERATEVVSEAVERAPADAAIATVARAAVAGRLSPRGAVQLQRLAGNRAVTRIATGRASRRLQRKSDEERAMVHKDAGERGTTDELIADNFGNQWWWDAFDRSVTLFTPESGPNAGWGLQIVYKEGSTEEINKRPQDFIDNAERLSPIRLAALDYLRRTQGFYQEKAEDVAGRVASAGTGKPTLCYAHTSSFSSLLSKQDPTMQLGTALAGMDPRAGAIKLGRAGAFRTLQSHPSGPRPGDIVSYGKIEPAPRPGANRQTQFHTILHIGVFKSRRSLPNGQELWTVVDGGQGKFEGRQEIRERYRTFARETLDVLIPKETTASDKAKTWEAKRVPIECGVLKSKKADAGMSADDKLLRGWVDIDDLFGGGTAPTRTLQGVDNPVFIGTKKAAELKAKEEQPVPAG
jgi:hypothetical protein